MPQPRKHKQGDLEDEAARAEQRVKDTILALTRYRGWSQVELAARAGLGRANLNGKLTGATKITIGEMSQIATVLGVPIDVLHRESREAIRWLLDNDTPPELET